MKYLYRFRYIPLLLFIIGTSIAVSHVQANGAPIKFIVVETVSLFIDGSINPVLVNLTKDFDHVMRIVWNLVWGEVNIDFDQFGTLAGPLTNGTEVFYNGTSVNGAVTAIKDFGTVSYDVRIDTDDIALTTNHLYSRLSFFKIVDPLKGLDVHNFDLQFQINDDITAACDDFFALVQGYKFVTLSEEIQEFPLNPFEYFDRWARWAMTEPLIWLTIILGIAVFVFMAKKFNIF